jgi:hypothetical protein
MLARRVHAALGGLLLGLVLGDARGLVEQAAPVIGTRRDDESDAPLLDDGVGLRAHARAQEKLHDVSEARRHAVEKVFAVAAAIETTGHHHLLGTYGAPGDAAWRGVRAKRQRIEGQRHLRQTGRTPGFGAGEDHVIHGAAAKMLRGLLPHDPANRVDDVRLAASVGAHDRRDRFREAYRGPIDERFEPTDIDALDLQSVLRAKVVARCCDNT